MVIGFFATITQGFSLTHSVHRAPGHLYMCCR
uniref:Uncharacterized protein n=1 Tax=Rhizophora mucronata TaxID=61149 RepID=A0A2P2NWC6_RHIMU